METNFYIDKKYKHLASSIDAANTFLSHLTDFFKAWKGLKSIHQKYCTDTCNICPSENDEITDGLEDIVRRFDEESMEEMLECIVEFIENNKHWLSNDIFKQQMKHAIDMIYFWRGMEKMTHIPHMKFLIARETGSLLTMKNTRVYLQENVYYIDLLRKKYDKNFWK